MSRKQYSNPLFLLRAVASVAYIAIGVLLLLQPATLTFLYKTGNLALGAVLLMYGCYRAWRLQKEFRQEK